MTNNTATEVYNAKPLENIRETVENAIKMARATGKTIIVEMNSARFSVNGDTKIQDAIDAYLEVKRKIYETEKQLKQNKR